LTARGITATVAMKGHDSRNRVDRKFEIGLTVGSGFKWEALVSWSLLVGSTVGHVFGFNDSIVAKSKQASKQADSTAVKSTEDAGP